MQRKGGFDPNILAFDTSLPEVSVALRCDVILAELHEPMARGQAERLMGAIEAVLCKESAEFGDIDAIAVGIGPGNFTGIRISVAAARGLALSLGIPAIGVSSFEAMADPTGPLAEPALVVSLPAPRDQAYVQTLRYGVAVGAPQLIDPSDPPRSLELPANMAVRGHRAEEIARPFGAKSVEAAPTHLAIQISAMAEIKMRDTTFDPTLRPAPQYVRAPDAAPPKISPPVILS